ncbi:PTS sugar transporter subunit IIA [Streptococcus orisasini]|uniref:PTS sugar transporter subunit IIA n=1 Tax=Streptococcus orisasini TaxID=1080071 RepID=UPI00070C6D3B|nr:fructose PTS transporter subunit IIA [Streptococcus orisasini]
MEKTDIIRQELIFLDCEQTGKDQIIKWIAKAAEAIRYVSDADLFFQAVLKREAEVPTAIGYDIAIPHGKTDVVKKPFIAFLRTKKKFRWSQEDNEKVQLIFLIGVPETGTEKLHLKFISQVSKKLLDEHFRQELLQQDKDQVFQLLHAIDI